MNKKLLLISLAILAGVLLLIFLLNIFVKQKVENQLTDLDPPVEYTHLGVNILTNNFELSTVETRRKTFALTAKKVQLSGLSYYNFLFKDQIEIDQIRMEEPNIRSFPRDSVKKDSSEKRNFRVGTLLLKNGHFSRSASDTAKPDFFVSFPELEVQGFQNAYEVDFDTYRADVDSVYLKMNAEHTVQIGGAILNSGEVQLIDLQIVPNYSKNVFDQKIPYEKDRITLKIDTISLEALKWEKVRDTIFLENSKMLISNAFLEIYRNKLVKDDERRKAIYNELLRKAPFKLNFQQVLVENSEIIYEEQVQENRKPAIIRFTGVSADIKNLHNLTDTEIPQPKISASANFMRGTPVQLNWTFPVFDSNNSFHISGSFGKLQGEALDPFLVPALDLQARGEILGVDFNFNGNENSLSGIFKMDYENLKVELLKDEGTEKKNFFSAIANLFVENEGEPNPEEIRVEVERNKKRSFWNFVWLGLRKGFIETVNQL